MDFESISNDFPFYREGTEEIRKELLGAAQPVELKEGDFFYHEGETCAQFALLGSGSIRVYKTGKSGRQITLYHVGKGQTCMVNIICALLQRKAPASAQAETHVTALLIPVDVLNRWIQEDNGLRKYVFESLSMRLLETMELVEEVAFGKMDRRLVDYLQHHFSASDGAPEQTLKITHEEIATELGTAREVVSRLLGELQRSGALALGRGRIDLLDEDRLRAARNGE